MKLDDLAAHGRRYKTLGDEIAALEVERKEVSKRITDELLRRSATTVTHGGVTITTSSRRVGFDVEVLRERLRPGVFRAVTTLNVDSDALFEQIKAGKATQGDAFAAERRSRSFPKVTLGEAA